MKMRRARILLLEEIFRLKNELEAPSCPLYFDPEKDKKSRQDLEASLRECQEELKIIQEMRG